jgi:hypothetical protein
MIWKNIIKKSKTALLECQVKPISVNGIIYLDGDCGNSYLTIKSKNHPLVLQGLKQNYLTDLNGEIVTNFLLKTQSYEKSIAFHTKMKELLEKSGVIVKINKFID